MYGNIVNSLVILACDLVGQRIIVPIPVNSALPMLYRGISLGEADIFDIVISRLYCINYRNKTILLHFSTPIREGVLPFSRDWPSQ